jgi:hypothetical protein
LSELGFTLEQKKEVILYTDSQSAKAIAEKYIAHERTKHINIRHHYVRQMYRKER